jgi:hypothetical protein
MKLTPPLVYGLIACIFLVSAPHAEHLPLWVSALSAVMLAWRAYLSYTGNSLPKRWLLLLVTLVCVSAIALSFRTLFGREVGVTLLILLGSLKLLELREVRDATVLLRHYHQFFLLAKYSYRTVYVVLVADHYDHLGTSTDGYTGVEISITYRCDDLAASNSPFATDLCAVPSRTRPSLGDASRCVRQQRTFRYHVAGKYEQVDTI